AAAIGWLSRVSHPESRQLRLAAEAVELLEPLGPSLELAAAVARLAMIRMIARDLDAAEEAARQALDLTATLSRAGVTAAEPVGPADLDPGERSLAGVEVAALQALGAARTLTGREPDARHLREAIERAGRAAAGRRPARRVRAGGGQAEHAGGRRARVLDVAARAARRAAGVRVRAVPAARGRRPRCRRGGLDPDRLPIRGGGRGRGRRGRGRGPVRAGGVHRARRPAGAGPGGAAAARARCPLDPARAPGQHRTG